MAGHDIGEEDGVQVRQGLFSVPRGLDPYSEGICVKAVLVASERNST